MIRGVAFFITVDGFNCSFFVDFYADFCVVDLIIDFCWIDLLLLMFCLTVVWFCRCFCDLLNVDFWVWWFLLDSTLVSSFLDLFYINFYLELIVLFLEYIWTIYIYFLFFNKICVIIYVNNFYVIFLYSDFM